MKLNPIIAISPAGLSSQKLGMRPIVKSAKVRPPDALNMSRLIPRKHVINAIVWRIAVPINFGLSLIVFSFCFSIWIELSLIPSFCNITISALTVLFVLVQFLLYLSFWCVSTVLLMLVRFFSAIFCLSLCNN